MPYFTILFCEHEGPKDGTFVGENMRSKKRHIQEICFQAVDLKDALEKISSSINNFIEEQK